MNRTLGDVSGPLSMVRCVNIYEGTDVDALFREYKQAMAGPFTDDGGHLNEKGRKVVAGQFLIFLCSAGR